MLPEKNQEKKTCLKRNATEFHLDAPKFPPEI